MTGQTRKNRKSPSESATSFSEGTMKDGWVIKKIGKSHRWMPQESVELNGFRLFTVDYAAKHLGEDLPLFCREYKDMWPTANAWSKKEDSTHIVMMFSANGYAGPQGVAKRLDNWYKKRTPIKAGTRFMLDGSLYMCKNVKCSSSDFVGDGVQVDSRGQKLISTDFLGTEVFVKV
jgi:hypothetical protein